MFLNVGTTFIKPVQHIELENPKLDVFEEKKIILWVIVDKFGRIYSTALNKQQISSICEKFLEIHPKNDFKVIKLEGIYK